MTIFTRVINGDIPSTMVHSDEHCVAIEDINPQADIHILVIPRKEIPRLSLASPEDQTLLGHLLLVAKQVAKQAGLTDFKLLINDGEGAGMTVPHLHVHVLGYRSGGTFTGAIPTTG